MARERFDGAPTGGRGEGGGPHGADTLSWAEVSEAISSRLEGSGVDSPGWAFDPDDNKLGRFEIRGVLGRGGQGVVLLAWDPRRECLVAMKLPAIGGAAADVGRIVADARDASRLRHPNVVIVHEVNTLFEAIDYIILEHCEGGSLADWLGRRAAAGGTGPPLPPRRACGFLAPVADAVAYAHRKDRLHRDIKPGNVLLRHRPEVESPAALDDFQPVLTDFGLAVAYDRATGTTDERAGEGTAAYMAPEQLERRPVGPAADIYSLGVILYELLCGGRMYEELDREALAEAVRRGRWRPLRERASWVSVEMARVVERCLRLNPGDRYPDAATLAEDLRRLARDELPTVPDLPWTAHTSDFVRRHRGDVVGSGLVVAAAVVGGFVGWRWLHERGQDAVLRQLALAEAAALSTVVDAVDLGIDRVRAAVEAMAVGEDRLAARNAHHALLRPHGCDADHGGSAFDALLDAAPGEWAALADLYGRHRGDLTERLRATVAAKPPAGVDAAARARHDKRRAAAVCTLLLRDDESAWGHLRFTPQPQVRSFAIEYLGPAGIGADRLLNMAKKGNDASIRAAAVLALGQVPEGSWMKDAAGDLLTIYRNEPDAGLHAACKWLLLKWARDAESRAGLTVEGLAEVDAELAELGAREGFGWRIGPLGLTLVRLEIPAVDGRPGRVIEMSDCELTVGQVRSIMPSVEYETLVSPTADCPINDRTAFEVAWFCNRLSELDGLNEQRAYEEPDGVDGLGQARDLLPDGLSRLGYRLPTDREFTIGVRGGARDGFHFGDAIELLSEFAWYKDNLSMRHAQPVAGRKPSNGGLFDLIGNLQEWLEGEPGRLEATRRLRGGFACSSDGWAILKGDLDVVDLPGAGRSPLVTFRVARTVSSEADACR